MDNGEKEVRGSQRIEWMHPYIYGENKKPKDFLRICLYHVRAANDLIVEYDSTRDGWVLYSEVTVGFAKVDGHFGPVEEKREVGFVPAWQPDEQFEPDWDKIEGA